MYRKSNTILYFIAFYNIFMEPHEHLNNSTQLLKLEHNIQYYFIIKSIIM